MKLLTRAKNWLKTKTISLKDWIRSKLYNPTKSSLSFGLGALSGLIILALSFVIPIFIWFMFIDALLFSAVTALLGAGLLGTFAYLMATFIGVYLVASTCSNVMANICAVRPKRHLHVA